MRLPCHPFLIAAALIAIGGLAVGVGGCASKAPEPESAAAARTPEPEARPVPTGMAGGGGASGGAGASAGAGASQGSGASGGAGSSAAGGVSAGAGASSGASASAGVGTSSGAGALVCVGRSAASGASAGVGTSAGGGASAGVGTPAGGGASAGVGTPAPGGASAGVGTSAVGGASAGVGTSAAGGASAGVGTPASGGASAGVGRSAAGGASGCGGASADSAGGSATPRNRAQTSDERRAALDKRLNDSLGSFDDQLRKEQQRLARERDARQAAVTTVADGDTSNAKVAPDQNAETAENSATEHPHKPSVSQGGGTESRSARGGDLKSDKSAAGVGGNASGNGAVANEIPDGNDDDVVARRLRKAAEQETDPELKDKLWKEYVEYKKNAQGK
jgi:hypothetical protein